MTISAVRRSLVASLAVLAFGIAGGRAFGLSAPEAEMRLSDLVNAAREENGTQPLTRDAALDGVAREWSDGMARTGAFAHRPDLTARITAIEPNATAWAENIAWRRAAGALADGDLVQVHQDLLSSPGHYANVMGDFDRLGVGVHVEGAQLWVTYDFLNGPAIASPLSPASTPRGGSPGPAAPSPGPSSSPVGWFRVRRIATRRVRVTGWAVDSDTPSPIRIRIRVADRAKLRLASRGRDDVVRAFPALGARHGFAAYMTARASGSASPRSTRTPGERERSAAASRGARWLIPK